MNKKHFVRMAAMFKNALLAENCQTQQAQEVVLVLIDAFCEMAIEENKLFSKERFLSAIGIPDTLLVKK